jgi:hypothetical protein
MLTDHSEEHNASIFRADEYAEHERNRYRERDGQGPELIYFSALKTEYTVPQNFSKHLSYHVVSHPMTIFFK